MTTPDLSCPHGRAGQLPSNHALILMSSRGPVEHSIKDGKVVQRQSDGGVATVLGAVANHTESLWLAGARTEADRMVAAEAGSIPFGKSELRLITAAKETEDLHNDFCNTVLWFLQHSLFERLQRDDLEQYMLNAWQQGYIPMNLAYAEALGRETQGEVESVMIHDYHLYAAPLFIRGAHPRAYLQHFVHIPWPSACEWTYLPDLISESICNSLIANDSVVFHTQDSVTNFLETVATYIPAADIDYEAGLITHDGRQTRVWANPVSVDLEDLLNRLDDPELTQAQRNLEAALGTKTIVRVDRLDPSKNIAKGFQSFEYLLDLHPEWRGKTRFLAFLVPTRASIAEYQRHAQDVLHQVEAINARFGDEHWTPIQVFYQQDRMQALAALSLYDVLIVNSVVDGLNLVSKEGVVVNQRDGVLVLSKGVGSYQELRGFALGIEPDDIAGTAAALHEALQMSPVERQRRADGMRAVIVQHQFADWLQHMLEDVPSSAGEATDNGDSRPLATAGVN